MKNVEVTEPSDVDANNTVNSDKLVRTEPEAIKVERDVESDGDIMTTRNTSVIIINPVINRRHRRHHRTVMTIRLTTIDTLSVQWLRLSGTIITQHQVISMTWIQVMIYRYSHKHSGLTCCH